MVATVEIQDAGSVSDEDGSLLSPNICASKRMVGEETWIISRGQMHFDVTVGASMAAE